MTENSYELNYKIRYSEMDCNLLLKPSSLLQLLQDIASINAEYLDFGYSFLIKKNLAWFLLKTHIEFEEYPKNIYDLKIKTQPRGWNKLFAFRDFGIYSNNKKLGKATTTWGLIDLNTKSLAHVGKILAENPNFLPFEKKENDLKYNKILPLQNITTEKTFEIRFDDLDVNQHVNNSNYLLWAFETLNYSFRNTKTLKTLDMIFKKEIQYGFNVLCQTQIANNTTTHLLKNASTNEELCLVQAEWI